MATVKRGTPEYNKAYKDKSIASYNRDTQSYDLAIPLEEVKVTPRNNLDLGQVVRNGTDKIGKPLGIAFLEAASLHPILGLARAGVNMKFAKSLGEKTMLGLSALPVPFIKNLTKARKIVYPVEKVVSKVEPGVTRITLRNPKKDLGYIELSDSFEKTAGYNTVYPEYIKTYERGKGLQPALYAAGLKEMKKPIVSGDVLLQPEKTTKVYKYFDGIDLPPLLEDEGYNYARKVLTKPKNPKLYEDTIKNYQERSAKYTDNLSELWKLINNGKR